MSSNLNSNDLVRDYIYKSQFYEEYPSNNVTSVNYGIDHLLQNVNDLSPRISRMRRVDYLKNSGGIFNENIIKSKDDFSILNSNIRQSSEWRSGNDFGNVSTVRMRTVHKQSSTFKDLPVKVQNRRQHTLSNFSQPNKLENISSEKSQFKYISQLDIPDNSLFGLIQSQNKSNLESAPISPQSKIEIVSLASSPESIVPLRKIQNESTPQKRSQYDSESTAQQKFQYDSESSAQQRSQYDSESSAQQRSQYDSESTAQQRSQDDSESTAQKRFQYDSESSAQQGSQYDSESSAQQRSQYDSESSAQQRFQYDSESTAQQRSQYDSDVNNNEIARLNKKMNRMIKELSISESNNKKLQEHLNNLLNERKALLNQIENFEFEEIIEEEEIQNAKQKAGPKENISRIEYVQEASNSTEISHINCLQKRTVTLEDIPQYMLESLKNDILRDEREKTEIEKRSLVETLRIQQKKQLLEAENKNKKQAHYDASTQSTNTMHYNDVVLETNFKENSLPKLILKSKCLQVFPSVGNKQCQYDDTQARILLNQYKTKSTVSNIQRAMMEKLIKAIEMNDYESLLNTLELDFCKQMRSIGINTSVICSSKTSNTDAKVKIDAMTQENIITEDLKHKRSLENQTVVAKPIFVTRGCQLYNNRQFETGTMTDNIFSRSQGIMTDFDNVDQRSEETSDVRLTNRLESRKQIFSESSSISAPAYDLINIHESYISPSLTKFTKAAPMEIDVESIVEVKSVKNETIPKPKALNITEEVEYIVGKKTQQVTSVLDSNKVLKKEIPTTIECWETISHTKDGHIIEESETYHDRLVNTDLDTIKSHLDQNEQLQSKEFSPTLKGEPTNLMYSSSGVTRSNQNSTSFNNITFIYDYLNKPSEIKEVNIQEKESSYSLTKPTVNINDSSLITIKSDSLNSNISRKYINNSVNTFLIFRNMKAEYGELQITETTILYCSQLIVWIKSLNFITTVTINSLPPSLITASSVLIEWWTDVSVKVDSLELTKIIKFVIKTFSKLLLKYLIINLDQQGNSCLHYIIMKHQWDSFDVLDSTNLVDPNIYNSHGFTLLMIACTLNFTTNSDLKKFQRLVSISKLNLKSKFEGQTAIFIAALHNNSQLIQILYTMGADINIRDNDDVTPLMIACSKNYIDAVTTILSWSGVLLDLKNKEGKSALDISEDAQFTELIEIFKQRKSMKASELSNYSRIMQNTYCAKNFFSAKK